MTTDNRQLDLAPESVTTTTQRLTARLHERAADLSQRPLSARSADAYLADWKHWEAFCDAHALPSWPPTQRTARLWLAYQLDAGAAVSTLRRRWSALRVCADEGGAPLGPIEPATANVLQNAARERASQGRRPRRAKALRAEHLRAVLRALEQPWRRSNGRSYELRAHQRDRLRALLLVGWFGCLRAAELCALRWRDVELREDGAACLWLAAPKNNPTAADYVVLPPGLTPDTCPVRALRTWAGARLATAGTTGRIWPYEGRVFGEHLSPREVRRLVARWAARAGLPAGQWSGHSLRRGGATEAVDAGRPQSVVQAQTRHRSADVFSAYVETESLSAPAATAGLL